MMMSSHSLGRGSDPCQAESHSRRAMSVKVRGDTFPEAESTLRFGANFLPHNPEGVGCL